MRFTRLLITVLLLVPSAVFGEELKSVQLREKAAEVREDQVKTLKILDGALERLRATYKPGTNALSTAYEEWKKTYNEFAGHVEESGQRTGELDEIATGLFTEWEAEAQSMTDSSLKSRSLDKLDDTKSKYSAIKEQLAARGGETKKVLAQLKDRVLFIKHNLNAESFQVLRDESEEIEDDIEDLIAEMREALTKIDKFIGTLQ